MDKDPNTFQQFCGRRWLSGQSLHLADDYMLAVNSGMFQETYRRFYYRDIQAIIIRRTGDATGMIVLMLIILVISLLVVIGVEDQAPRTIMGVFGGGVLLNLIRLIAGQGSCLCYIQTPVSIQRLSIFNIRTAQRLLDALAPRIEAVQGPSTREALRQRMAQPQVSPMPSAATVNTPPPSPQPPLAEPAPQEPAQGDPLVAEQVIFPQGPQESQ